MPPHPPITLQLANGVTITVTLDTPGPALDVLTLVEQSIARTRAARGTVHVCGPIGVGKSTLVESFRAHGWSVAPETIPSHVLREYITPGSTGIVNPPLTVNWGFQLIAMDRSIQRSENDGVVERPWYENQVFAWANRAMGKLTTAQYIEYTKWIELLRNYNAKNPAYTRRAARTTAIMLWATEDVCLERIGVRDREGESAYEPQYKDYLEHAYFMLVLQSRLLGEVLEIPYLHVIDWRNYGDCTSSSVRRALANVQGVQLRFENAIEDPDEICDTLDLDRYFALVDASDHQARDIRAKFMAMLTYELSGGEPIRVETARSSRARLANFFSTCGDPLTGIATRDE